MTQKSTANPIKRLINQRSYSGISRRKFLKLVGISGTAAVLAACSPDQKATEITPTPISSASTPTVQQITPSSTPRSVNYSHLPRWRGFNLLEKFNYHSNSPFQETDLDYMVEWGFDFVRLPMDYRIWTISPGRYLEQPLQEIDQLIAWARNRGIHVNLCLHRAPGYCVGLPKETLNLWADDADGEEARQQLADQWRMFALRYKGIPGRDLSFNLVNEPPDISESEYTKALSPAIKAIREEDPDRLVIIDGLSFGDKPVLELVNQKVAQSTRGYAPSFISQYYASWIDGADKWPVPTWPIPLVINQFFYGEIKPEFKSPLTITGDFPENAQLSVKIHEVSGTASLIIKTNGIIRFKKVFRPENGEGEWKESIYRQEWNSYLGIYDRVYSTPIPENTHEIQIEVTEGDWLTISELTIDPFPGAKTKKLEIIFGDTTWGQKHEAVTLDSAGNITLASGKVRFNQESLWIENVEPWKKFSDQYRIGVHVGEWGAYNQTPHSVVLAWMKDCLDNWKKAGMGWALWNLRGSYGVLDSDRSDVVYEDYKGHKLDREMLKMIMEG